MRTTLGFIADLKARYGLESDYAIAKLLDVTKVTLSSYRNGKSHFSDEIALRVADLLDLDPAYVMACVHAEREKNAQVKAVWSRMAERMAIAAALAGVAIVVGHALPWEHSGGLLLAAFTGNASPAVYIMSNAAPIALALLALAWLAFPRHHRRKK